MGVRIRLQVVDLHEGEDSVVPATDAGFALLKGGDDDHLACGSCDEVLAWNVSRDSARELFVVAKRLLFRCPCGAHNLIRPRALRADAPSSATERLVRSEA